jgi:hypothetical protein
MNSKIGIVATVVIALLLSWFFFFQEYFAYQKVLDSNDIYECRSYYGDYTNGRYTKDVKLLEIEWSGDFKLVKDFVKKYPNDVDNAKFLEIKKELWQKVSDTYNLKIIKANANYNDKAVSFFKEALNYMAAQNEYVIKVKMNKDLDLKDYEDYSEDARSYLELLYTFADERTPFSNTISLTDNFSSGDISSLENIINDGLTEAFKKVFGTDFFEVKSESSLHSENLNNPLVIEIDFKIRNQMIDIEEYEITELWTYTQNELFQAYVPAIMIDFDFQFKIPETTKSYNFSNSVDPASQVSGFGSLEEGYQMMTRTVFNNYADKITIDFGLE